MKKITSFIFIFMAMVIWGTSFLVMKNTLDTINAGFLIFLRASICFIILLPFSFKHIKKLTKYDFILILSTGFFVSLGYLTQAIGLNYTTPGKSAFLENAYCIVVPIITCIILRKKPTVPNIICIVLCLLGVVFISIDSIDSKVGIGEILSIAAGVFYGVNIALTGIYSKKVNPIAYTCGQFFTISLISGLYSLIFEDNSSIDINMPTILRIAYLGVVVTALAWIFRNIAQQNLNPLTVSLILPFSAVVGTIISIFFKEDILTASLIIGGLLITISILIDGMAPKKKREKEKAE